MSSHSPLQACSLRLEAFFRPRESLMRNGRRSDAKMKCSGIQCDLLERDDLKVESSRECTEGLLNLFVKNGVYYSTVKLSRTGEPLEIALHGAVSEEQARAAVRALTSCWNE